MMVATQRIEDIPAEYPSPPSSLLSAAAALIDPAVIWSRIEQFIAYRYSKRAVHWYVENDTPCTGWFVADLAPVTMTKAERWTGTAWEEVTLTPGPFAGYIIEARGLYRFTGTAGDDDAAIPEPVWEAYRRLAEFVSEDDLVPAGAGRASVRTGSVSLSVSRDPAWKAKALHLSGAADLLRPWRRAHNV